MKFSQVAHHYVGCKVQWQSNVHFTNDDPEYVTTDFTLSDAKWLMSANPKPLLFPLSAMTEEQKAERDRLGIKAFDKTSFSSISGLSKATFNRQVAEVTYLLSQHFDLFNLIESGEAIDATTLTPNPYDK